MYKCPQPNVWIGVYEDLLKIHREQGVAEDPPPPPLILGGSIFSSASEKHQQWLDTLAWADRNGCAHIVSGLRDYQFASWDFDEPACSPPDYNYEPRLRPKDDELSEALKHLKAEWKLVVGEELGAISYPSLFTGRKKRRLVVFAAEGHQPPWGSWHAIDRDPESFTQFRAAINLAIAPLEIDHVEFEPVGILPVPHPDATPHHRK